jgi:hypothetical protein
MNDRSNERIANREIPHNTPPPQYPYSGEPAVQSSLAAA